VPAAAAARAPPGLPEDRRHAAEVAAQALRRAALDYLHRRDARGHGAGQAA
jgi:hypothetical protein